MKFDFNPSQIEAAGYSAKVSQRTLRVAIIGLGYVGLPLLLRFHELGFPVIGLDLSESRLSMLIQGKSPIRHISDDAVAGIHTGASCELTADFSALSSADAIIVCVPTPLTHNKTPDMSFVEGAATHIANYVRRGQLVVLESTVYPGATEEYFIPALTERGFNPGVDVHLAYSPEREDPGNTQFSAKNTPKLCGGYTPACLAMATQLYTEVTSEVIAVSSIQTAEMAKLLENIYRCVNIGLVNEMKMVADRMGINIHEVISAAATKPFGFTPFWPGPGLGGHCIPIDPFYMTWRAKEFDIDTKFIELAGQVNSSMPNFVVEKVIFALNEHHKSVRSSNILICGISYKKNIDDLRESPAISIMNNLKRLGAKIYFEDMYVNEFNIHEIPHGVERARIPYEYEQYDCIVIATDHDYMNYEAMKISGIPIVDARGRYRETFSNLYRA